MTTKPTHKHYHHGDLHDQLIAAATRLIRDQGIAALSMRKLADSLSVSRTAPYHHFDSKEALLCAIATTGFMRFCEEVITATRQPGSEIAPYSRDHFALFVQRYLSFATEFPEYYNLMFGAPLWQSDKITPDFQRAGHAAFRAYVDMIRDWQAAGAIQPGKDPLRYAQLSWSTLHGMSRLLLDGIYIEQSAMAHLRDTATDSLWGLFQG